MPQPTLILSPAHDALRADQQQSLVLAEALSPEGAPATVYLAGLGNVGVVHAPHTADISYGTVGPTSALILAKFFTRKMPG